MTRPNDGLLGARHTGAPTAAKNAIAIGSMFFRAPPARQAARLSEMLAAAEGKT